MRRSTVSGRLLREPLLHFLLLGGLLFGGYALARNDEPERAGRIVITPGQIEQLAIGFTRTWRRPPTQDELRSLIDDRVREEVMYREAMSMGLDRDDTIVRRRLRQKLEFLIPDLASRMAPPSERDLQGYLSQHADQYREEPMIAFEQLFFDSERRGSAAARDARSVLERLDGSEANLETIGDPSLLPAEMNGVPEGEVARVFGAAFGQSLAKAPLGRWTGPLESGYGLHLVLVRDRMPGRVPPLADIREKVLRDLLAERRQHALDAAYEKFRAQYEVVLELPPHAAPAQPPAARTR